MNNTKEKAAQGIFTLAAFISIVAITLICIFLFAKGIPAIKEIGFTNFILGKEWSPTNSNASFGIMPMKCGNIVNTNGCSILTASIFLGIMILPTIISVSEAAIRAVTNTYYEGARALGATHERSVFRVIVPAAKSGILAGVILGVGRAIGETMAVIMVAGNQARMPESIFAGVRTMTANIVIEMGYATGLHREALIATGMVLFIFILIINQCFSMLKRKEL